MLNIIIVVMVLVLLPVVLRFAFVVLVVVPAAVVLDAADLVGCEWAIAAKEVFNRK